MCRAVTRAVDTLVSRCFLVRKVDMHDVLYVRCTCYGILRRVNCFILCTLIYAKHSHKFFTKYTRNQVTRM